MRIPISNRLLCCARMVTPGARVADVGCDHGYLGIYLLLSRRASFVAELDLRSGPLETARRNAARFGVGEQMFFAVCDGLQALGQGVVNTVVCAGMGGDTIVKILSDCPWIVDPGVQLILQPQSSGNDLRRWLGEHGFSILQERLVQDGNFLYTAMETRWGGGQPVSPGRQYVSEQILGEEPALVRAYFQRIIGGIQRAVDGLSRARDCREAERLSYYKTALREILEMRERYENGIGDHKRLV